MAAGGSGSSTGSTGSTPPDAMYAGPHSPYTADGMARGDCPEDGANGGGGSTTPDTAPAPSTPSQQDGSSNPSL